MVKTKKHENIVEFSSVSSKFFRVKLCPKIISAERETGNS